MLEIRELLGAPVRGPPALPKVKLFNKRAQFFFLFEYIVRCFKINDQSLGAGKARLLDTRHTQQQCRLTTFDFACRLTTGHHPVLGSAPGKTHLHCVHYTSFLVCSPNMVHLVDKKFGGELSKADVFGVEVGSACDL